MEAWHCGDIWDIVERNSLVRANEGSQFSSDNLGFSRYFGVGYGKPRVKRDSLLAQVRESFVAFEQEGFT